MELTDQEKQVLDFVNSIAFGVRATMLVRLLNMDRVCPWCPLQMPTRFYKPRSFERIPVPGRYTNKVLSILDKLADAKLIRRDRSASRTPFFVRNG